MADPLSNNWPAPAKLNRFLHIVGQRPDGYHLLQTVFQFLDYCDLLDFQLRTDGQVILQSPIEGVPTEKNLIFRAAKLLQSHSGSAMGVKISLEKKLPTGGGLGGGSSDAATVLVALNHLWGLDYSHRHLARLGLELGADVPVFINGKAVWAEGVGEQFQDIGLDEPWFCVIVPAVNVSTADIFSDRELTRNTSPITISDFIGGAGSNDCEALVAAKYPEIKTVIEWMKRYSDTHSGCIVRTRMTGTGACVFAGFETEQDAREVQLQIPPGQVAFVAKGLNQSPLLKRLDEEAGKTSG